MLLALSRSVAEFEPRRHLADGGSTTRPAGLEEVARAFRRALRRHVSPAGVPATPTTGRNSIRSVVVPADGTSAATVGNGDFGTSPFFGQLSGQQLPACTWSRGVPGVKHNGGPELIKCGALCQGPARQKGGRCVAFPRVAKADQDNIASSGLDMRG